MSSPPARGRIVVVLLVGLTIGALAGTWFGSSLVGNASRSASDMDANPKEAARDHAHPAAVLDTPVASSSRTATANESEPLSHAVAECPVYGEAQRAHGERGIREGWKAVRKDEVADTELTAGLARYEELVLVSPTRIGRDLAEARNATDAAREDAARGGLFALLKSLEQNKAGPLVDVVSDDEQLDAYFQRSSKGARFVDGGADRVHPQKDLEDGGTISFPAGVFRIRDILRDKAPFPRDVTITGAGIDATLLIMESTFTPRSDLVNLTLRDCTIDTNGKDLISLNSQWASLTLQRLRIVGFRGALLGAKGLAVRGIDSSFLGGYGKNAMLAGLVDVRSNALLARFDRCRFDQISLNVHWLRPGATVVMNGCVLTDLLDEQPFVPGAHAGFVLNDCTVTYLAGGMDAAQAKDLNTLFPDWATRQER